MKKLMAVLLVCITFLTVLSGCSGSKSYVGNYYSKEARAMGWESYLTIYDENNEQVFEIEHVYSETYSVLIQGEYEVKTDKKLVLNPKIKITMINNLPSEEDVTDQTSIKAEIKGDVISLDEGILYIKEGSKTAETDTTAKATKKSEKKSDEKKDK